MKGFVFYTIAGGVVAAIAQAAGASFAVTLFASLLIPPVLLLVYRILR